MTKKKSRTFYIDFSIVVLRSPGLSDIEAYSFYILKTPERTKQQKRHLSKSYPS
jgi:hypothetical protein